MLVRDILLEKAVSPGERKAILLKIDAYKKKLNQIQTFKDQAYAMNNSEHPPGMKEKIGELIVQYNYAIKKLEQELEGNKDEDEYGNNKRLKKLLAGIQKNCSEAVASYKKANKFLYRGTNEDAEAFFGKPYDERAAKDSSQEFSDALNWALEQKGIAARRDNSIFTGSSGQADGYGRRVYIIFPVNGFKFSWSTAFSDLVLDGAKAKNMLDPDKVKKLHEIIISNHDLMKEYADQTYIDDIGKDAIMTEYGFLGRGTFMRQWKVLKELAMKGKLGELGDAINVRGYKALVSPDETIKFFQIRDDDFVAAIEANTEVVIRGAYYGIRKDFENRIRQILGMKSSFW